MPCAFLIPNNGGMPEEICESCTARGFSSDGSVVNPMTFVRGYTVPHWCN
jgi:hypothetical protein